MCLQISSVSTTIVVKYYIDSDPKTGHSVCAPKIHYLAIKFMSYFRSLYKYPRSLHLKLHIGTLLNIIVTIQSTNVGLSNSGSSLCLYKPTRTKYIQSQYYPRRHIEAIDSQVEHSEIDAKQGQKLATCVFQSMTTDVRSCNPFKTTNCHEQTFTMLHIFETMHLLKKIMTLTICYKPLANWQLVS